MPRKEWAVAHYRRYANQVGNLDVVYYYRARKPGFQKRTLHKSENSARKHASKYRDKYWFAAVYRVGHKPVRVWTITLGRW
jgi:hypothetical protein